jgi:predicted PurR-regulated permease PerM
MKKQQQIMSAAPLKQSDWPLKIIADAGWRAELGGIAKNFSVYGGLSIILLCFPLRSGESLMRRFIHSLPSPRDKTVVTRMAQHAQTQMSPYLLTITAKNLLVGSITTLVLWILEFPDPALWESIAALLRYVPYLGVSPTVILLSIVSAVSFSNPITIIAIPLGWLWGAPGLLLAVPLLTLFQVICQHSESLLPLAHIIGDTNE